jgi:hypothetical protein
MKNPPADGRVAPEARSSRAEEAGAVLGMAVFTGRPTRAARTARRGRATS